LGSALKWAEVAVMLKELWRTMTTLVAKKLLAAPLAAEVAQLKSRW
jgi:hypothetical protein